MSAAQENERQLLICDSNKCENFLEETSDRTSNNTCSVSRIVNLPHLGLLLAVLAAVSYSFNQISMKIAFNVGLQVKEYLFWHALAAAVLLLLVLPVQGWHVNVKRNEVIYVILSGFFFAIANLFSAYAFKYTSAVYATSLFNTQIIFAAFLSLCLLKEPIDKFDIGIIFFVLTGSVLIANPFQLENVTDDSQKHTVIQHLIGCLCSVAVSFFMSCLALISRKLQHANPVFISLMGLTCLTVLGAAYSEFQIELPKTKYQWMWLLFASLGISLAIFLRNAACQLENITYVSLVLTLETPIVLVLQWTLLKQLSGIYESCGIIITVISVIAWLLKRIYLNRKNTVDPS
ncbi:Uncharacterised protein r2_g3172 [Pycnogonum litorale]